MTSRTDFNDGEQKVGTRMCSEIELKKKGGREYEKTKEGIY